MLHVTSQKKKNVFYCHDIVLLLCTAFKVFSFMAHITRGKEFLKGT